MADNPAAPAAGNPETHPDALPPGTPLAPADNVQPAASPADTTVSHIPGVPAPASTDAGSVAKSWKAGLAPDLRDSALLQKFEDTTDGLSKAMESHANLEKLLGHDKVPIPKSIDDVEGWNRFSKAMGIPDKAENYGLADVSLPGNMKDFAIDKNRFAEIVHAHKLTPSQATGLWKIYNEINVDTYKKVEEQNQNQLNETVNRLKGDWGDAYDTNVELGQLVINQFSDDAEMNDYLTATLSKDPRGIKFLAKVGNNFAENKIGEFQMKKFTLGPEEAQAEIDKTKSDLEGPYMNTRGKFTAAEHQAAIDRVNSLIASVQRARG